MRVKTPHTILFVCVFIQAARADQQNDHLKNSQRTNPKKYHSTSTAQYGLSEVKLRHHSKFPHLDKLKTRIANLDSNSESSDFSGGTKYDFYNNKNPYSSNSKWYSGSSDSRWVSSDTSYPRLRHHGWSNRRTTSTTTTTTTTTEIPEDEDLFESYGDLEEDDDSNYDDLFDTSNDDDTEEIDGDFDDGDVQAEEPTETPTTEQRRYSSISEYKWAELGTYQKVQEARQKYIKQQQNKSPEETKVEAFREHYRRVSTTGQCKNPTLKVIPVQQEHPDSSVTYVPHCTMLHRCADDTGCCTWDSTCQYKERVEVSFYFYVKQIGDPTMKVEKLTFYNHTKCECKRKSPEGSTTTTDRDKRVAGADVTSSTISLKSANSVHQNRMPENLLIKCKCPKEFVPKQRYSKCYCDCDVDNEDCMRMKKGLEYYSLKDRLCLLNKECGTVACEYGPYITQRGRCPKINEVRS